MLGCEVDGHSQVATLGHTYRSPTVPATSVDAQRSILLWLRATTTQGGRPEALGLGLTRWH